MTNHPLVFLTDQEIFDEAYCGRYRESQEEELDEAYYSDEEYYVDEAYRGNIKDRVLNLVCDDYETPSEWLSPEVDRFWEMLDISPETVSPQRKAFLAALRLTDNADLEEGDDPMEPLREFALYRGLLVPELDF